MALRLHVIYAGRGDAFVLEDGNQIWVIDGGPLGYAAEGRGGAPYYSYLVAAIEKVAARIKQPAGTVTLSGIVVSHAHEDHYGGVFELLDKFVSRTYAPAPTQQWPFVFNGPLVTQPLDDPTQVGQRALQAAVDTFHYAEQVPPTPLDLGPFRLGAQAAFPRLVFGRPQPPRPQLGRVWTVDESPDNLASVLMLHRAGRMLFTGDSVGAKITPFLTQVVGQQDQPLWIFKVPHHGSLRNSQRIAGVARVPARAWHEYALLCLTLTSEEWDVWQVPPPLQEAGAMAVARGELEDICAKNRVSYDTLAAELKTAVGANLQAAAAGGQVNWRYTTINTPPLWKQLCRNLESRAVIATSSRRPGPSRKRGHDELMKGVSPSWYWALMTANLLTEPYLAEFAFAELKAFYGSFAAYNYVISADGSHGHPAAETIAAIAASRSAAVPTVRVFVTDAAAIDLQRIANLAGPGWRSKVDLRALYSGSEIVLDLSDPNYAKPPNPAIDPDGTTTSVAAIAEPDRTQLRQQLQQGLGPQLAPRAVNREQYWARIPGANPLYLGLDARGEPSVTANPTSFTLEEAWTLQPPQVQVQMVRLAAAAPGGQRLFELIDRGGGRWALHLVPLSEYVSTDAARHYRTTDLNDPNLAVFEFAKVTPPQGLLARGLGRLGEVVRRLRSTPAPASTLRAFLEAAQLPTGSPLSGQEALAALAGPAAAATIRAETKLPVLARVFGWEADLDSSTVTWSSDAEGLLVEAATVSVKVGQPATFTIEGTTETIASTWLALARSEQQLTVTAGLKTTDGTELDHAATIAAPGRGRPLSEYLTAVGVAPAEQGEVTVVGVLSRMLGSQSLLEQLLMSGPSFIAAAGIGVAKLDVGASEVETFASPTGGLDVISARLVTKQASIADSVGGVALTLEGLVFTVEGALLADASLTLTAAARITPPGTGSQPVSLRAECVLSEDRPELALSLAEGATLGDVIALLPGAPTLGNLEVPVAGQTLGAVSLSSLGLSLRQPVEDADGYVVSSVFGAIEFSDWGRILPAGFPAVASGKVSVRVFEPEDPVQRRIGFEGEVGFQLASGRRLTAAVRAWPMAGSGDTEAVDRSLAKSVAVWADPAEPVTLAEIVSAFGLPSVESLPAPLGGLVQSIALEEIAIELKDGSGGTEVASFQIALAIAKAWEPLSGFSLTAGRLDLRYDGSEWGGEVEATMLLGGTIAIEAGYVVPTATTAGAFTFAPVAPLNLKEAAEKIGLGALSEVPLLGSVLETVSVTEVALALAAGTATVPTVTSRSLGLLLDTIEIGPLTVNGVAFDLTRTVPASETEEAQTSLWIEAELGGNAILDVAWDSAKGKLAGSLRMLEPQTLDQMLATLLGGDAPTNVLLPIVGDFAVIAAEVEFDTAGRELKAFRLDLDTSKVLKLGPATISTLGIVYEAGTEAGKPTTYALTGRLSGQNLGAKIEVGCEAEPGTTTVNASIKSVGPGPEALTLEGLVSMFGLTEPTVPSLQGAPSFLSLEVSEVTAKLSHASELGLEELKAKVQSTTSIPLVATTPPLELKRLSLEVAYKKAASQTLTGTIFGELTVPSTPAVTATLEYSVDEGGLGVFEGALSLQEDQPGFESLLAQGPFDPGAGGGLPANIGLPSRIPMAELTVRVERPRSPQPTSVTVSGFALPTKWEWEALGIHFAVKELGGTVTVTAPAAQGEALHYDCSLFGRLTFGHFEGRATLAFGAGRNTVLTAVTTEAQTVALPEVAGMLSGGGEARWAEVVPAETEALGFSQGSKAYAYFDLTAGSFVLLGSLAGFGTGALVSHPGTGDARSFAFLASLSSSFRFANLWRELRVVDEHVAIRTANLALIDYSGGLAELKADIVAVEKAAAAEGVSLERPFAGLDWLDVPGRGPTQLTKGGAFFADLALSTEAPLSRNLESIVEDPAEATAITFYALVDHAVPKNTVYHGNIVNLTLLGGGLVLAGDVTYSPAAEAAQLEAEGSLTLKLDAAEKGHEFDGKLTLGSEKATFAAKTEGDPVRIEDPFGGMFGISIAKAELAAEFDFSGQGTTSRIAVSGEVAFKVVIALKLRAAILFSDGKPVLAKAELPGTVSLDELLRGIGLPWPDGYEVLTLENGSVYYAPEPVTFAGLPYEQGYHMAVTAKVLGHAIGIDVGVASDGIVAQAVVEAGLDFYFLQLTGYEEAGHTYKGPFVRISTREPTSFTVGSGVSLFHTPIGSTTLTYYPSPASEWTGSVTVASTVTVLGGTTVEFSYSEANGFRLTNMGLLSDAIKWAQLANQLIDASSQSACGEFVGLAWDSVVETKVNTRFTQNGAPDSEGLPFAIEGTFDVIVAGAKIVTVPLPKLEGTVPRPDSFELSELPSWLLDLLTENLYKMAVSLFKEKEKLATLIGALAGVKAARAGLTALICRGVETENIKTETTESVDSGVEEVGTGAGEVATAAGSALDATSLATAAAATVLAAGLLAGLEKLVNELVKLIDAAIDFLSGGSGKKSQAEHDRDTAREKVEEAEKRMQEVLTMAGAPTAAFSSSDPTEVLVSWNDADRPAKPNFEYEGYAGVTYLAQVSTTKGFDSGVASGEVPGTTSPIAARLRELASVNYGYARIRAVYRHEGREWRGPWKEAAVPAFHVVPLPPPARVTQELSPDGDTITVTVARVEEATGYTVTLVDPAKPTTILLHKQVPAPSSGPAVASLDTRLLPASLATGATLVAVAVAEGDPALHTPSAPATSPPLPTSAPASVPAVAVEADGLHVTWAEAQTAPRPELRVEVGGALLSPQPRLLSWDADGKGCLLGVEGIAAGETAGVEMRLPDPAHVALWSSPATTVPVPMLAPPEHFTAHFDCAATDLVLGWDEDAEVTWGVECRAAGGAPLSPVPTIATGPSGATVVGPAIAVGGAYEVRARRLKTGSVSLWSDWLTVTAAAVPAPAGLTVSFPLPAVKATWDSVPSAGSYRVQLLAQPGGTVAGEATPSITEASFDLETPLDPEAECEVAVRALVGTSLGVPATARAATPSMLELLEASHAASTSATDAAAAALAYQPKLGYAELLVTLAAAGYPVAEAEAATLARFPGSDLGPLVAALPMPARLAPLLTGATPSVPAPVIVRLAAKLFTGKPVELTIQLRLGGLSQDVVAAALPGAYPSLTPAQANAIGRAAYVEPWALGAQLFAGSVAEARVVPDLLDAYPKLSALQAMASLNASYRVAKSTEPVGAALAARYPDEWGPALGVLLASPKGKALAEHLRVENVSRQEAASYLHAAFPSLSAKVVNELIEAAYGPAVD